MNVGSLNFEVIADTRKLLQDLKKVTDQAYKVEVEVITPKVDSRQLHELNRVLDSKQKHLQETRAKFAGNAIAPRVDLTQLHLLNRHLSDLSNKQVNVKVKIDTEYANKQQKEVNQKVKHEVKVSSEDNANRVSNTVSKESKQIAKILLSSKKGIVGKALGVTGAIAGSIGNSLLT
ncbi:MAG: hypothetical protein ACRCYP_04475, partial [Alphaproteobacteria bacterium]